MQRENRTTGTFGVACLGLLGCAGVAGLVTGLHAHASRSGEPTPVEIIANRFPSGMAVAAVAAQVAYSAAQPAPAEGLELFNPNPFYPLPAAAAAEPAIAPAAPAAAKPETTKADKPAINKAETAQPAASGAARSNAAQRRSASGSGSPGSVLNDAQIANIKRRLKLTPDQEQMWPAVEAALRNIAYNRHAAEARIHAAPPGVGAMAYIDPDSDEVRQLKYAALPLIMRLDDDQRREVKMMAHVMGLESVASHF